MAYYLAKERRKDVAGAYRRYQEYLKGNKHRFPSGAFALGTSEWWQDANIHSSPHDAWLESLIFSEPSSGERSQNRTTAIKVWLLAAYHDGFIELFYPRVFNFSLESADCQAGIGDWMYDEFRLSEAGNVIHEIEWSKGARWIIEASDVEYKWIPKETA